jgi:hypothetical protein
MPRVVSRAVILAAALFIVFPVAPSARAASLKVVALQAESSPVAGAPYRKFVKRGPAVGGGAGERVVFEGLAIGTSKVKGIFAEEPGVGGSVIAQKGGPTGDGGLFRTFKKTFTNPAIDSAGTVVLSSKLRGGFGEGVYARKAGDTTLTTIVRTGDVAGGLPSGFLKRFSYTEPIGLVATTAVAFIADISAVPNVGGVDVDEVIYTCSGGDLNCHVGSGTLTPIVMRGDDVDDRPGDRICDITHLASSEFGVAFRASVGPDCLLGPLTPAILRKAFGGSVETLAIEGGTAAFTMSTYTQFRRAIDVANDGTVAFLARTMSQAFIGVRTAMFICDPATCPAAPAEAAVSVGDTLPGGNLIRFFEMPRTVISDAGEMAFYAKSNGPQKGKTGIYIRRANGTIEKIAEKGDTAPKLTLAEPDSVFRSVRKVVAMSDDGRVAFLAKTKRDVGPMKTRQGVFVFE